VGAGRVGIVLGLEVSRLARSSVDWQRLLETCSLTDTLILDEDGVYDPTQFNDRVLLGFKGTMSEAELYGLKGRLRGGVLSKARREELKNPLPVGLVYGPNDEVLLDPLTGRLKKRWAFSSRRFAGPARSPRGSVSSASRTCCSPSGCTAGPTRASCAGSHWSITASCGS